MISNFFLKKKNISIKKIFPKINKNFIIKEIKPLHLAKKRDLTFFDSIKYKSQALKTNASACITTAKLKFFLPKNVEPIIVSSVLFELAKVIKKIYPTADIDYPDLTLKTPAKSKYISVKFGNNVLVGKGVKIGKNTIIGYNTIIEHSVQIGKDCIIGSSPIIKQKKLLKPDEYKVKVDKLRSQVSSLQKERNTLLESTSKQRNKARNELLKNLNPIIKSYMQEKKIRMVVDKKSLLLADDNLNITKEIMGRLNKQLKSIKLN